METLCPLKMLIFQLLFICSLTGQNPSNCLDALEVCDGNDLLISMQDLNSQPTGSIIDFCGNSSIPLFSVDSNVIWIKYSFSTTGDFVFDIIPDSFGVDIDFIVFKSEFNNCDSLEGIRCMSAGDFDPNSVCMGPTGLSFNATDTIENAGCSQGQDNYLAPLEIVAGDVIYLLIRIFDSSVHEYRIEHGGSAEISCDLVSNREIQIDKNITLFPNPVKDYLKIEWNSNSITTKEVSIFTVNGQKIYSDQIISGKEVDTSHLINGVYLVQINDLKGRKITKKLIKI